MMPLQNISMSVASSCKGKTIRESLLRSWQFFLEGKYLTQCAHNPF